MARLVVTLGLHELMQLVVRMLVFARLKLEVSVVKNVPWDQVIGDNQRCRSEMISRKI